MPYPRADCPECSRDTAVTPLSQRVCRHDPPGGRTPDLRSCPGSLKKVRLRPDEDEPPGLFEI
jgi:hypothetical protein